MAPIKFEENIREKLQERELTPSDNTWAKLETQLDAAPSKRKPTFLWMAIAASFVGILLVTTLVFRDKGIVDETELTNNDSNTKQEEKNSNDLFIIPENQEDQLTISEDKLDDLEVLEISSKDQKTSELPVVRHEKKIVTSLEKKTNVAVANIDENVSNEIVEKQSDFIGKNKELVNTAIAKEDIRPDASNKNPLIKEDKLTTFIDGKVNEVVAQVHSIKNNNNEVTVADIDALLANAQKDIAMKRILSETKVDALALLNDVELEMEESFRARVFEALGDGFNKVRTAVADRNN